MLNFAIVTLGLAMAACNVLGGSMSVSSTDMYRGQQVVQILGADAHASQNLVEAHVHEIFRRNWRQGGLTARVSPDQIDNLKALGFDVNVVIDELDAHLAKTLGNNHPLVRRNVQSNLSIKYDDWFTTYHSFEEKYKYYESLAKVKLAEGVDKSWLVYKKIGKTLENRDIVTFELGNPKAKDVIYMQSGIHAREWIGPAVLEYTLHEYITKLASGKFQDMFNRFKFIYVPIINVDGYHFSYLTDRLWRKNRAINSNATCPGVDLNRNYNGYNGWKLIDDQCSSGYGGPKALSEPETRVMDKYLTSLNKTHRFLAMFDTHARSEYLVFPYGYDFDLPDSPNRAELQSLGNHMCDHINLVNGHNYISWNSADWYPASGATDDYFHDKFARGPWGGGYGMVYVVEMRPQPGDPIGHMLPENQILPAAKEWIAGYDAAVVWVISEINKEQGVTITYPPKSENPLKKSP